MFQSKHLFAFMQKANFCSWLWFHIFVVTMLVTNFWLYTEDMYMLSVCVCVCVFVFVFVYIGVCTLFCILICCITCEIRYIHIHMCSVVAVAAILFCSNNL